MFKKFMQQHNPRKMTEAELVTHLRNKGFYLGGSKRLKEKWEEYYIPSLMENKKFENVDDYDLSCCYSDYSHKELLTLGFKDIELGPESFHYKDISFHRLMKHEEYKIDVVSRYSFDRYKNIWENTDLTFWYDYLWKSAPHHEGKDKGQIKQFITDWLNDQLNRPVVRG